MMYYFKILCVLLFITISSKADKAPFFRKDYTFLVDDHIFVKIHNETMRWADAVSACDKEDAELFYPVNRNEAMILQFMPSFNNTFWLGIHDMIVEGYFETIYGEDVRDIFEVWAPDEPTLAEGQNCVNFDGHYRTKDCESKASFVCKKRVDSKFVYNENCNTFDRSYIDYTRNEEKCYKVHTTPRNWHDAANTCIMEYSNLYVLQSSREASELESLIPRNFSEADGFVDPSLFHSGFHDFFSIGLYMTIQGTPLYKTGYNVWDKNYPKSYSGARCGSVVSGGRLQNVDCSIKAGFICERPYQHIVDTTTVYPPTKW